MNAMDVLKRLAIKALSKKLFALKSQRVVLLYHDVSKPGSPQYSELYSTMPETFKMHMEWLGRHFRVVSLDEIVQVGLPASSKPLVAVTFDDGFRSVKDEVFRWMHARALPFAVFVNGLAVTENRLNYAKNYPELKTTFDERVYLDAPDLRFLANQGVIIGNHCATHCILTTCTEAELHDEVVGNKQLLEEITGKTIRHLAIPYGKHSHYDDRVLAKCHASHKHVYSSSPAIFNAARLNGTDLLIPRIGLTNQTIPQLTFMLNRPHFKTIDI